jgi:hypothetical protein
VALLEGYDLQVISVAGPQLQKAMQLLPPQMFSARASRRKVGTGFRQKRCSNNKAMLKQ